jgi:hypothetical protein
MSIRIARETLGRLFLQRCFYLFVLLLLLVAIVPFVEPTPRGRLLIGAVNAFLVIATTATVGRTLVSFVIALLLAAPTLAFQYLGITSDSRELLALSWTFAGALYAATIVYLLRYVFQPEVMTTDKLFGAAAGYLMLGVLWAYLYSLIDYHHPGSFAIGGQAASLESNDAIYFSFTVLTSTGFGDIVPVSRQARATSYSSM